MVLEEDVFKSNVIFTIHLTQWVRNIRMPNKLLISLFSCKRCAGNVNNSKWQASLSEIPMGEINHLDVIFKFMIHCLLMDFFFHTIVQMSYVYDVGFMHLKE